MIILGLADEQGTSMVGVLDMKSSRYKISMRAHAESVYRLYFRALAVFLLLGAISQNAAALDPQSGQSGKEPAEQDILQGIEHLYDNRFKKAEDVFYRAIKERPEDPKAYFYLAMISWSRLAAGFWSDKDVEEYRVRINKTISIARKRIANDNEDPLAHFYLGGALGFKGRFQLMRRKWISALFLALEAVEALKTCRSLAPNNREVLLGLGIFDYYTSRLSGVLKFMSYLLISREGKEEGLRKLHIAAREATYSAVESKSVLLHIYLFMEHDHHRALPLARELSARFQTNPRYKYLEGVTYMMLNMDSEYNRVVGYFRENEKKITSKSHACMWGNHAYYLEACHDLFHDRFPEARTKLKLVLDRCDPIADPAMAAWPLLKVGMSHDLEGNRDRALECYTMILRMENGAGAQFLAEKYTENPVDRGDPFLGY